LPLACLSCLRHRFSSALSGATMSSGHDRSRCSCYRQFRADRMCRHCSLPKVHQRLLRKSRPFDISLISQKNHCWKHEFGIKAGVQRVENCGVPRTKMLRSPESYTLHAPQRCDASMCLSLHVLQLGAEIHAVALFWLPCPRRLGLCFASISPH